VLAGPHRKPLAPPPFRRWIAYDPTVD